MVSVILKVNHLYSWPDVIPFTARCDTKYTRLLVLHFFYSLVTCVLEHLKKKKLFVMQVLNLIKLECGGFNLTVLRRSLSNADNNLRHIAIYWPGICLDRYLEVFCWRPVTGLGLDLPWFRSSRITHANTAPPFFWLQLLDHHHCWNYLKLQVF